MSNSSSAPVFVMRVEGPAPEIEVSRDLIKRGLLVTPVYLAFCGAVWGLDGVWSGAYGVAIVLANFFLAALTIALTARISLGLMMGAVLFGYLGRLGLIFLAVLLVKDAGWVSIIALGITLIVTHLGLLFWEMRYIAASLAFPALKPGSANIGDATSGSVAMAEDLNEI